MQCYTQLTAPTAVSHSISLPFLSASANNLVVAKTSLLQIFSLKSTISHTLDKGSSNDAQASAQIKRQSVNGLGVSGQDSSTTRAERLPTTKLVLVAQYELSGTITSLARVKILHSKSGGEALLVALRDAKLSLIEWDPERFSISTISIHYYEREDIPSSPWEPDLGHCVNYLSVDPSSRCAVYKFGVRHLAILPFHQIGDDLVMDDYDPDLDGERPERKVSISKNNMADASIEKTPYAASFVLSLLALDPSLSHPIHLSFLHEYREPTFGVLYSQVASSSALLHERRDNVSFAVYNLDLEQRASTTLLSVNNLPWDMFAVYPLMRSIGGVLLLGTNQIIHVDQSGKSNGIAVNDFAKQSTSFSLADQSDLGMRLENCLIKELGVDNTDMLIILSNGELAILSFKIDGRSVSSLSMRRAHSENGFSALLAGPSCASIIGRGRFFIGSERADSVILGWYRKHDRQKRKRSIAEIEDGGDEIDIDIDEEDLEADEDDLYNDDEREQQASAEAVSTLSSEKIDYTFRLHDSLINVGPMTDVLLRTALQDESDTLSKDAILGSEIVTVSGQDKAGSITIFQRDIRSNLTEQYDIDIAGVQGVWSINIRQSQEKTASGSSQRSYDNYLFISSLDAAGLEKSTVYRIKGRNLEEIQDFELDTDAGNTIEIGMINGGTVVAQVSQNQVRTYDADFGLAQIQPLTEPDEDTTQPEVVSASFADPYILVIRDDQSAVVLTADDRGEFEEENRTVAGQWLSGSLYEDSNDNLRVEYPDDSDEESGNVLMFLLSVAGGLQLRSVNDDIIVYQPYQAPLEGKKDTSLRFLKIPNPHIPQVPKESLDDDQRETPRQALRTLPDVQGYSAVVKRGSSPSFIIRSASSQPQVFDFAGDFLRSVGSLHTLSCQSGFVYTNEEGKIRNAQLPVQSQYETGWIARRISVGEEVHALSYHAKQDAYVLGTGVTVDFKLPEDDFHSRWSDEDIQFLPQAEQGSIKLLDGKTYQIIDSYALEPYEVITTIKTLSLEISEMTHKRDSLIVVGTSFLRGEDLPSAGHIYIFAIITVVPEPDLPHTNRALKLIAKEEVKGAVTAISSIGTQGFLMVAQGQKCMVRGLKEDGTLLPVAFMDMQCFVSVVKELPENSGLCLMADAVKGVWFTGYMEEPYQLRLFGKSPHHIEVIAADFLPDGKQLYIVAADADCNLQILQFDPEHPKSLTGQRLLHHTTFHTGHFPSTLTLIPPSPPSPSTPPSTPSSTQQPPHPLLLTTQTGSLALLTPLTSSQHRTLSALQSHVQNTLPHYCGLNPRAYRVPSGGAAGTGVLGRGGIVDGGLVKRWMEGGRWRWWGGGDGVGMGMGEGEGEGEEGVRGLVARVAGGRGVF
ncbi:mRNA cleavage and polyadenylation factor subunit [Lecanora helva]